MCKKMSLGSFKKFTNSIFLQIICIYIYIYIYIYKEDLTLNKLEKTHKTEPDQINHNPKIEEPK